MIARDLFTGATPVKTYKKVTLCISLAANVRWECSCINTRLKAEMARVYSKIFVLMIARKLTEEQ